MNKLILVCLLCLCPVQALAWERTMTCEPPNCGDKTPLPTYWEDPCVAFHLNIAGTRKMNFADVQKIVKISVDAWYHPDISSLTPHLSGLTDEDRVGYNPYIDQNANIIVFRDDEWTEAGEMMALTTVTHRNSTGRIYDADIEINTANWDYGIVEKDGKNVVDLQNTLTHEIGHVFGLAHSQNLEATMFPYSSTGETNLRSLEDDDLEAIAAIYPPSGNACVFRDGTFQKPPYDMDEAPVKDEDCSSQPRTPHTTPLWLFIVAMGMLLRRRTASFL